MAKGKGHNALSTLPVDWKKTGICQVCTLRLTDPNCTHATDEQRQYVRQLDEEFYASTKSGKADKALRETIQQENDRISAWLSENWDLIPEVPF